jgi:hypothetical protein
VAIYKHYKRSELGDVLVAGGVIAEGSCTALQERAMLLEAHV